VRHLATLAAFSLAALALAACTGNDCPSGATCKVATDGGTSATTPADWGLADNLCWHYVDTSGNERYTIGVTVDDNKSVPGVNTFMLEYKLQGLRVQAEWLEPKGDELLLHQRDSQPLGAAADTLWRYDPSVDLFEKGLEAGDSRVTNTNGKRTGGGQPAATVALVLTTSAFASESLQIMGKATDAQKFVLTQQFPDGTTINDRVWIADKTGIVKYDPQDDPDQGEFTLSLIETLPAGKACAPQ
jgi:hypothetical protein